MKHEYFISVYLDTRRAKESGKFPVKLRVYTSNPRKQKLYPTVFEFSQKDFKSIWETTKPRKEHKAVRKQLLALETKAQDVADKLTPFTFEQFERHLYRKAGDGINVRYHYDQNIQELIRKQRIGTADSYELSQKSIMNFVENEQRGNYDKLTFFDITPDWLENYENYMTKTLGRTQTTVGIYLRALRAIFNKAIDEKEIEADYYPFGKRQYQIPASKNVKKALSRDQLSILYNSKPETPEQQKAKDFWFFSFACNGMNIKDIALLKYKDIQDGRIEFYRAKTLNTSKGNLKPVVAYLNEYTNGVIEKYGNKNKASENLVFDILSLKMTPTQIHSKIKNFNRFLNQHLKKLCKANGLPEQISGYWARHSFATNAVRKGATLEFMQECLGHGNVSTTQKYFAGFDDDSKKEFAKNLMNFD